MTRDPIAELYAARAAGRARQTLMVPVDAPFLRGTTYWLTMSQYLALSWLRRRMRHARGETTLEVMAKQLGTTPGALSRRLDRLAQLSLIGRHSTRGRLGRTRFWPPRRRRVELEARVRTGPAGNVATSTPFGGFLSREGLGRALRGATGPPLRPASSGGSPPATGGDRSSARSAGRRRPPRLVWARCPLDGGRVRLGRGEVRVTDWQHHGGPRRLRGLWAGRCPRCKSLSIAPVDVSVPRPDLVRPRGIGDRPEPVIQRTPERAAIAASLLDARLPADPELREQLRARWIPDRLPDAAALEAAAGPPLPRRELLPVLVASAPADTPALVDLARSWMAGDADLEALEPAGYGPGRAWWDLSAAAGRPGAAATMPRRASRRGGRARTPTEEPDA